MKKVILLALTAMLAITMLGSCSTTFTATNGKLAYGQINGTDKGAFEAKGPVTYIIHPSLISLKATNKELDTIIEPALAAQGANGAKNVEIVYGFDIVGMIIRYVTGGLLGWDYVKVTGTAVKY